MSVKEAAARYDVSRAKLHRLVQLGRLNTEKDPRDERVTLLRGDELESLFRFPSEDVQEEPAEEVSDAVDASGTAELETETDDTAGHEGRLTAKLRAQADELRRRVAGRLNPASGSGVMIGEQRDRRGEHLRGVVFGKDTTDEYQK